ncbi:4Fe-4S dicluster domain-containing protein [Adlercreutzia sp. R7]|uniref:4Fe-4S dicluster domain-containing protein n=1 Tax=Adlercreutzia wanghongyangiae TaxID=3111451 RepID=A0ABU6IEM9_9ACTN|nr:4Fe-4S dicluster domain-containing protein [Adlercreutzia sp. R7]
MVERIDAAAHRHVGAAFQAVDSAAVRVHRERCAKVRNRNVDCLKCAAACTSGCICLEDGELIIDADRCVGCGTCATVCPTCALEALNPSDAELKAACLRAARASRGGRTVVVACHPAREALGDAAGGDAVVPVVCAGRVDESLLVTLAAEGVQQATVLCGPCERCAQRHGRDTAELVAETARRLLGAWGGDLDIVVADCPSDSALLDAVVNEAVGCAPAALMQAAATDGEVPSYSATERLPHVMKDGTLPHFLPDRRERLLDALAQLGSPAEGVLESRLWGAVVIDGARCVSCRMCATFCPTGAIVKFDDADGTLGVTHAPGDCVKCGSCQDICPAGAIALLDEVPLRWLAEGQRHRYAMTPRAVSLADNPHQILDTFRQTFNGDIFER